MCGERTGPMSQGGGQRQVAKDSHKQTTDKSAAVMREKSAVRRVYVRPLSGESKVVMANIRRIIASEGGIWRPPPYTPHFGVAAASKVER